MTNVFTVIAELMDELDELKEKRYWDRHWWKKADRAKLVGDMNDALTKCTGCGHEQCASGNLFVISLQVAALGNPESKFERDVLAAWSKAAEKMKDMAMERGINQLLNQETE